MFIMLIDKVTKRKREQLLRLRCSRYRQTPIYLKRVKAHAIWREPSTLFLIDSVNFADFQKQESRDASTYISFLCLCYVTISDLFLGFNIIIL